MTDPQQHEEALTGLLNTLDQYDWKHSPQQPRCETAVARAIESSSTTGRLRYTLHNNATLKLTLTRPEDPRLAKIELECSLDKQLARYDSPITDLIADTQRIIANRYQTQYTTADKHTVTPLTAIIPESYDTEIFEDTIDAMCNATDELKCYHHSVYHSLTAFRDYKV
jgi:hypothetical protein